ncbi:MAG: hypothetical protein V3U43_08080 [Pseudomonadales bacterium]
MKRAAKRAVLERYGLYEILDEALIGHVAFVKKGELRSVLITIVHIDDEVHVDVTEARDENCAKEELCRAQFFFPASSSRRSELRSALTASLIAGRLADEREPTPQRLHGAGVLPRFGQAGPNSGRAAYASIVHVESGMAHR